MAIRRFKSKSVEDFFLTGRLGKGIGWAGIAKVVLRKLDLVDYAGQLKDLLASPGNQLEALKGDLTGFHSIRVNLQWRILFRWTEEGPDEVDVVDYHH